MIRRTCAGTSALMRPTIQAVLRRLCAGALFSGGSSLMVSKAYRGRMPLPRLTMRNGSFGSLRPAPLPPVAGCPRGHSESRGLAARAGAEIQKFLARPF